MHDKAHAAMHRQRKCFDYYHQSAMYSVVLQIISKNNQHDAASLAMNENHSPYLGEASGTKVPSQHYSYGKVKMLISSTATGEGANNT